MDIAIRVIAVATTSIIIAAVCTSPVLGLDSFFSWHPIFMTIGTVLLLSLGVVSYVSNLGRSLNSKFPDRPSRRVVHGVIQMTALACLILGFLTAWAGHEHTNSSQIGKGDPKTIQAHVWMGYIVLFFAICNAILGQYKFIVKARDNRSIGQYHGHIGSLVYVFGMITVCLGVAHVCLHLTDSLLQHALGTTAIVLTSVLLLLVLTEVLCLPQVEASKGVSSEYPGQLDHFGLNSGDYRASLNGR